MAVTDRLHNLLYVTYLPGLCLRLFHMSARASGTLVMPIAQHFIRYTAEGCSSE